MRRWLTIAAVLGVVLLVAVALADQWIWDCPLCGGPADRGIAYYTCPTCGVFSTTAWYTDDYVGPPKRICTICALGDSCVADSAVCNSDSTHRWYPPFWNGYK